MRFSMFLRLPRADADRAGGGDEMIPPARRPAGRGRSGRSGRRAAAISDRSPAGRLLARAQVAARLAMVYLTGRKPDRAIAATSHHADCRSVGRSCASRRAAARGGARKATSDAMISRSTSSRISPAARRSGCAPTFYWAARAVGAIRPSRSNCIMRIAGANSKPLKPGGEGRRDPRGGSGTRLAEDAIGHGRASARNMRP